MRNLGVDFPTDHNHKADQIQSGQQDDDGTNTAIGFEVSGSLSRWEREETLQRVR
jgi:hypothetical protein